MKRRSTYQNIIAMPAKSWFEAATSAFGGNPRMTFYVVYSTDPPASTIMATLNQVPRSNLKRTAQTMAARPNNPPQMRKDRRKEKFRPVVTTTAVRRRNHPIVA